ncbi:SUMF1/EgtB/PvdO family nonheme iron enzyme, partial [bacterium]|nr:SUMF1/EgtB/PvdO family nonheme iron enzyme [bacterium]
NDWYGSYQGGSVTDPKGLESGYYRVLRGGSWRYFSDTDCRSTDRYSLLPNSRYNYLGFRVVRRQGGMVTPTQYKLTMTVNAIGWGTTNPSGEAHSYDSGTVVMITAIPASGYRFVSWTGEVASSTNATTTVTMTGNITVMAVFEKIPPPQYTLTLAVNTNGWGTTSPSVGAHTYDEGTVVTITATPESGYRFVNWTGNVADMGKVTTTVTMTGNMTVTANFELKDTISPWDNVGINYVQIPGGSFAMGSDTGDSDEKPIHTVTLSTFEMSIFEITQGQYKSVIGSNPSHFAGDDNLPVEEVSWLDAIRFCNALSVKAGLDECYYIDTATCDFTKNGFRLPTEAEWEYACRAGTSTAYNTGDTSSDLARAGWYSANSSSKAHPVGQKTPNAWGLYDMHGNVCEWCNDLYGSYRNMSETDPTGAQTGSTLVVRGGGWNTFYGYCRSTVRPDLKMDSKSNDLGFRVVRRP